MLCVLSVTLLTLVALLNSKSDEIINLPGLTWSINYTQYSGYLSINSTGHHLHYWLTESMSNPAKDPIVLWLNGGPGCSSMDGLLYEQGPFHVTDNGSLYENKYAWNANTNMIFLESPVCVGFSYSDDGNCQMSDNSTANENYLALLQFFIKYPHWISNDFFVTGESYGGVYVPTLVKRILHGNMNNEGTKINLKGFAVGNGLSSAADNDNSVIWMAYFHGLISETAWNSLMLECCSSPFDRHSCNFAVNSSTPFECQKSVYLVLDVIYGGKLNWYNIYGDCLQTENEKFPYAKYIRTMENIHKSFHESNNFKYIREMKLAVNENVPCVDSNGANIFLNSENVKNATHIPSDLDAIWSICSSSLDYESQYPTLAGVYKDIYEMDSDIWTTVYNGDTDLSCNFLGDQWFVADLGYNAIDEWHEWYMDDGDGEQIAGWTINYPRVAFVTVRGSGHMVPQYRPLQALKMFQYFLQNKAL